MYGIGKNRLFYSSKTGIGKTVEIDLLSPMLKRSNKIMMTPIDDIFYADVNFNEIGSYFIRVFENGIMKHTDILRVINNGLIIYPED